MIRALKIILKKIIFGTEQPKLFPSVKITAGGVLEKVLLKCRESTIDITDCHGILCSEPFLIAVWESGDLIAENEKSAMMVAITVGGELLASLSVHSARKVFQSGIEIIVLQIEIAKCFQPGRLRQWLIRKYFRKNRNKQEKIYEALYSFPRKIITVSFVDQDYYNIFPMDFQGLVRNEFFVLGLRKTNITLTKIRLHKKFAISDTDSANIDDVYLLGKHHSSEPPAGESLPFALTKTALFDIPIPVFSSTYFEVELVQDIELGSHVLLIAKVINSNQERKPNSSLHHLHFFATFTSSYEYAE